MKNELTEILQELEELREASRKLREVNLRLAEKRKLLFDLQEQNTEIKKTD